ncbi:MULTISPECIES: ATP-binding protein [Acetobacterales]|uniref:histidine kinase n=1 Tax=Teichococcus rhizosphaerae TaxID=1335062 RepID=A0A2C7ABQ9_9PROT|nr:MULTISPECIES: ATP-binding protein [Acetobacteraceae]MBS5904780.1 HAMP domain-containing protein [Acetobacteraceae bacterium]MBI0435915.1 HAMP domain-containing protein [Roseomonas sp. KE0001]MDT8312707.1 ATP-binding protein [Roseomonas mucosa]MDT8360140.1 ATP-binding protein [Roseomonas mucosa]PHK94524.1 two-component sensor histidine kinase [Pseudoroseomonas rhizosphaerae]
MRRLLPSTLAGRIILVLLVGLMAFHVGSLWLHQTGSDILLGSTQQKVTSERVGAAARAVGMVPPHARGAVAQALSSPGFQVRWQAGPATGAIGIQDLPHTGHLEAEGAVSLPDGSHLWYHADPLQAQPEHATLLSTTAMALGILVLGLLVVRLIARPLRELSNAADRIGRPGQTVTVPEEGPREVRQAAQAFNRMQARIDRLIADRTQALAAVSHDLRTPLARLRLRAGFLDDAEAQRQIDADLDEMDAMIASTLAYLRGDEEQEEVRSADIAAMLQTLCGDAEDMGKTASYEGPSQARLPCRAIALKRAFANIIDNAVKYGTSVRVALTDLGRELVVHVDDAGPGVPEEQLESVFQPFYRLEQSRNRGTGGSGLGLAIARQAVSRHGGSVTLENLAGGGLRASIRLPRPA